MREKEFAIMHVVLLDFSNVFTILKNETGIFKKKVSSLFDTIRKV